MNNTATIKANFRNLLDRACAYPTWSGLRNPIRASANCMQAIEDKCNEQSASSSFMAPSGTRDLIWDQCGTYVNDNYLNDPDELEDYYTDMHLCVRVLSMMGLANYSWQIPQIISLANTSACNSINLITSATPAITTKVIATTPHATSMITTAVATTTSLSQSFTSSFTSEAITSSISSAISTTVSSITNNIGNITRIGGGFFATQAGTGTVIALIIFFVMLAGITFLYYRSKINNQRHFDLGRPMIRPLPAPPGPAIQNLVDDPNYEYITVETDLNDEQSVAEYQTPKFVGSSDQSVLYDNVEMEDLSPNYDLASSADQIGNAIVNPVYDVASADKEDSNKIYLETRVN